MAPNRIVVALLFIFGIAGAILPVAANMDWTSTTGILGGLGAISAAGLLWLRGWQKWETNQSIERTTALNAIGSGREVPGETEGVKAEGFTPPPEGDPSLA